MAAARVVRVASFTTSHHSHTDGVTDYDRRRTRKVVDVAARLLRQRRPLLGDVVRHKVLAHLGCFAGHDGAARRVQAGLQGASSSANNAQLVEQQPSHHPLDLTSPSPRARVPVQCTLSLSVCVCVCVAVCGLLISGPTVPVVSLRASGRLPRGNKTVEDRDF